MSSLAMVAPIGVRPAFEAGIVGAYALVIGGFQGENRRNSDYRTRAIGGKGLKLFDLCKFVKEILGVRQRGPALSVAQTFPN